MAGNAIRPILPRRDGNRRLSVRSYAWVLGVLSLVFAVRVFGQAIQTWLPQPFLPPFAAFQGSELPYWILLPVQLLILGVMLGLSLSIGAGRLVPSARAGALLAWAGWIYMTVAFCRLGIGLAIPGAPAWFRAWIPGAWHVVLASFVLTLALFHRTTSKPPPDGERS